MIKLLMYFDLIELIHGPLPVVHESCNMSLAIAVQSILRLRHTSIECTIMFLVHILKTLWYFVDVVAKIVSEQPLILLLMNVLCLECVKLVNYDTLELYGIRLSGSQNSVETLNSANYLLPQRHRHCDWFIKQLQD